MLTANFWAYPIMTGDRFHRVAPGITLGVTLSPGGDGVLRLTPSGFWGRCVVLLLATHPVAFVVKPVAAGACCPEHLSAGLAIRSGHTLHPPPGLQAQGLTSSLGCDLTSLQQALGISTQNPHNASGAGGM